ncbi:MAG: hypothetical protein ISEC1_P0581 [Thiomicrorhabdus sp.]|nr:MAG: hypothetical protein ISEC1_P0581 [Thiomicrorhabdus sp.]
MKRKMISLMGVLATTCLLSTPVLAASDSHHGSVKAHGDWSSMGNMSSHGKQHGKSCVLRHKAELELTEKQFAEIKSLMRNAKKKTIGLKADIDIAEIDLKAIKHTDVVDMQQAAKLMKEMAAKEADIRITWMQFKVDSKAVLTDAQRAKLKDMRKQKYAGKGGKSN